MSGFPDRADAAGSVTVVTGNQTPADNTSPTDAVDSNDYNFVFDGTNWDRMRAGAPVADPGNVGVLAVAITATDGANFRRILSADGNTDALSVSFQSLCVAAYNRIFNGVNWDRFRSASSINNNAATSVGCFLTAPIGTWIISSAPAANTQATTSKAAGGGTVRNVCTGISATVVATGASVAGPVSIVLRDGASGAGTVLATWLLNVPAGVGVPNVPLVIQGLNISGSANTAMTIESTAAGGANTQIAVNATGYSTP